MRGVVVAAVASVLMLAGCGSPSDTEHVQVVAGFYPLQFVAERVGGEQVRVTNLAQPGAEPHDLELRPSQVAQIADADLVLYLPGFQPAVDEAVDQQAPDSSLDVAGTVALLDPPRGVDDAPVAPNGKDPHVWLDPTRLATIATAVAERLAELDPDNAAAYRDRARELNDDLVALDQEIAAALATCQRREIVVSHAAFGYFTDRYRLRQIPVTGLSPEDEPTPAHLAAAVDAARGSGATTIFFENLVSPRVAQTIADAVGATTAVLDPLEGLQPGSSGDYLSGMRANVSTLRPALGCA